MDTSGEHLFTTFVVAFSGKERNLNSFLTPKRSRRVDTEVMYKVDQRSECACVCVCVCEEREREGERERMCMCVRVCVCVSVRSNEWIAPDSSSLVHEERWHAVHA